MAATEVARPQVGIGTRRIPVQQIGRAVVGLGDERHAFVERTAGHIDLLLGKPHVQLPPDEDDRAVVSQQHPVVIGDQKIGFALELVGHGRRDARDCVDVVDHNVTVADALVHVIVRAPGRGRGRRVPQTVVGLAGVLLVVEHALVGKITGLAVGGGDNVVAGAEVGHVAVGRDVGGVGVERIEVLAGLLGGFEDVLCVACPSVTTSRKSHAASAPAHANSKMDMIFFMSLEF